MNEVIKALEEGLKKLSEEPSKEQIAFENGYKYAVSVFWDLTKDYDDLQQELTKYKERCEKAIEYIDNTFILTSRDYAKEISDFKINLKTILQNKEKE